jgi:hypothetical protein
MSTLTNDQKFAEGSNLLANWQAVKTCKITLKLVS